MYVVIYSVYQELADGDCGVVAVTDNLEQAQNIMKKEYEKELVCMAQCGRTAKLNLHPKGCVVTLDEDSSEKADHWIWKIEKLVSEVAANF